VDELRAYRWNQLSPDRAERIASHLSECTACARESAELLGPAPAGATPRESAASAVRQNITFLIARLLPQVRGPAPVLRGSHADSAVYGVEGKGWEIALSQATEAGGYVLTGHLLGPDEEELTSAYASLLSQDVLVDETPLDSSGWFALRHDAPGPHTVWIETLDARVEIPNLQLGSPAQTG
jgi:hypothetical protein